MRDAQAIIGGLDLWRGEARIEPIPAGYTNENFRVFAGGESFFARAGEDLPLHGISRRNEARCARLAADAGISPEVLHAHGGVLVTRFVDGRSLKLDGTPPDGTVAAVARLLARVHRLPAPCEVGDVDLVEVCRRYLARCGMDLAPGDRARLEDLLAAAPVLERSCLVHGDAFPENFIDDGRRLWLVDWEYAGRGHPAGDLAYVAMNFQLSSEGIRRLVDAHGGGVDAAAVEALLPAAAARDILWCLTEARARGGLEEPLRSYTRLCCDRLGIRAPAGALRSPRGS